MEGMKRVTVTIPVEVDLCFTELAKKRNISKDKLMSSILVDWHNTPSSFSKEYVQELKDELENERNKYDSVYEEKVKLEIRLEKMQKHNSRGAGRKELLSDSTKADMKLKRDQGYTMREIAAIYECSTGLVCKIVNSNE